MNNTRCIYCNKKSPSYSMVKSINKGVETEYPCCSLKCYKRANRFFKYNSHFLWIYCLIMILLFTISYLELKRHIPVHSINITAIVIGLFFIAFPFSSRKNFEWWSIKNTKNATRIGGIPIILIGIIPLITDML